MQINKRLSLIAAFTAVSISPGWTQAQGMAESTQPAQTPAGHANHSALMKPMQQGAMPGMDHSGTSAPAYDMGGMDMGAMQGGSAPPDARDPHAYAGGQGFGPIPRPRLGDEHNFGSLLFDRLERARTSEDSFTAFDVLAWYGRDYDRAVLKAEGDIDGGKLQEARTELLWGHAIATFWDTQLGVRYDSGVGPDRKWLAFGVQGLAPYWFDVEATGYIGDQGRTALRFAASYDLLFTQKLVLQPRIEANAYGKSDPAREVGSGLSDLSAGVRLRYEIRREFAPYVGVEWGGKLGKTADIARADGAPVRETRLVAGVRFWF